jgi:hypothetical protein
MSIDNPPLMLETETDLEPSFRDYIERHHDKRFFIRKIEEERINDRNEMPVVSPMYYVGVSGELNGEESEEGFYHRELKLVRKLNQEWDE